MRTTYAVEFYAPPPRDAADGLADGLATMADDARRGGADVAYLGCVSLPEDEVQFHLFEATSSELLGRLLALTGLNPERIMPAATTGFGPPPG
jgi:hypothetical protein